MVDKKYKTTVFIVHGTKGSPQAHWFSWLKKELEGRGFDVVLEQYPTPENQNVETWLEILSKHEDKINTNTIFVGHSIAASFFLHYLERTNKQIAGVYVAGGFLEVSVNKEYDELNKTFMKKDFDFNKIKQNCKNFFIFHSKDDPYVPIVNGRKYAQSVGGQLIECEDAGHFNDETGYTEFEDLLRLIVKNTNISKWSTYKQGVNASANKLKYFHERELWWTHNGSNVGYEQDGHGEKFLRPSLILKKINRHLFIGIPQTSQDKIDHEYYYKYTYGGRQFILLLLQIRVFSSARLHEKLGMLNKKDYEKVKARFKEWL